MKQPDLIRVHIWGRRVGALAPAGKALAFQYDPKWEKLAVELAPFLMPLGSESRVFSFPSLNDETYRGAPGLVADALPDAFGNALINAWMSSRGIRAADVTTLDRLAYMGRRGMGALEFHPMYTGSVESAEPIRLQHLVEEARRAIHGGLSNDKAAKNALEDIIRVGTSAGGARAKAVIAWNQTTDEIRSGQFDVAPGFEHWLLKFDGVDPASIALGSPKTYGRIEYAYAQMAAAAGITMAPSRLLEENGRAHFMTKRFDRDGNTKVHMQSLCAIRHLDYNTPGVHAYEELFATADDLHVGAAAMTQLFARAAFNIVASNNDDHTKNFAFLLRENGAWEIAPAYDVTFSYRAESKWTREHQMSVNRKFSGITFDDLRLLADRYSIAAADETLQRVQLAVEQWKDFAASASVSKDHVSRVHARLTEIAPDFK